MNHKEVYPSIWVYKKGFTETQWVIDSVETSIKQDPTLEWKWASTDLENEDSQGSHRTNKSFSISRNQQNHDIEHVDIHVFENITKQVFEYSTFYDLGELHDEGYDILKYEKGNEYKIHNDWSPKHSNRVVSLVVYLNDDYSGGQLEFPNIGYTYRPRAGDIVIFPSNHTFAHRSKPITKGTKYAIVTWLGLTPKEDG